jgi:poly-gamma-glutamate capsule biosynthesis protein CapA/YwtB (metallophosphatase superfamily)
MPITLALAGDTMLGRKVGERLRAGPSRPLVAPEVAEVAGEADLFVMNLECCISDRGEPWPAAGKPFFFRAPPAAVDVLEQLGVDCVTLANNHALDFGEQALLDTLDHLASAGIEWVGAGPDVERARRPMTLTTRDGSRLAVVGLTDHPEDYAAGPSSAGVAFADLREQLPGWVTEAIRGVHEGVEPNAVLVTPHWGPNMTSSPVGHVRRAGRAMIEAGASFVAGHSAHVFHGVEGRVLWDLGDFLDDYAVDPVLRNDLGLLFLVTLDAAGPRRLEAVPLKLDFCFTRLAEDHDARWIATRFRNACAEMKTAAREEDGRLVVEW